MAFQILTTTAASITELKRVGVTWLAGFDFEIKVIARIP